MCELEDKIKELEEDLEIKDEVIQIKPICNSIKTN